MRKSMDEDLVERKCKGKFSRDFTWEQIINADLRMIDCVCCVVDWDEWEERDGRCGERWTVKDLLLFFLPIFESASLCIITKNSKTSVECFVYSTILTPSSSSSSTLLNRLGFAMFFKNVFSILLLCMLWCPPLLFSLVTSSICFFLALGGCLFSLFCYYSSSSSCML